MLKLHKLTKLIITDIRQIMKDTEKDIEDYEKEVWVTLQSDYRDWSIPKKLYRNNII